MRLVFAGLESPVDIVSGECVTLCVQNETLFTRIALSLMSGEGRNASEPYSFWCDDSEVNPKNALLFVSNPLEFPWDDRGVSNAILKRLERDYLADEDMRQVVEAARETVTSQLIALGMGLDSDYALGIEWDFKKLLKFMGFDVSYHQDRSYLDNLLNFLSLVSDAQDKRTVCFVNLKNFLSKSEFKAFLEHIFYLKIPVLLLENKQVVIKFNNERKLLIDQDFLEFYE